LRSFYETLSCSLFFSLSLSSQTTTETRKHTTTTNSEEKHLFLKTIAERGEKESKKFSPFVQKKTQKSHKVTRKSAEKESSANSLLPLLHSFSSHLLVTLYYTHAT